MLTKRSAAPTGRPSRLAAGCCARAEVSPAAPAELEAKIALLDPQVVVCCAPLPGDSAQASDIPEVTRTERLLSDCGWLLNSTPPSWVALRRAGRAG